MAGLGRCCLAALLLAIASIVGKAAALNTGKNVLVLLGTVKDKDSYSSYFNALTGRGYKLDIKGVKESTKFKEYGTWKYDHLVLLAPKAESFGGDLDVATITDFVDSGRSVVMAASSDVSETMRALASEFGVDLDDKGTRVYDHFQFADGSDHTLIAATNAVDSPTITGGKLTGPVLFRGIAATVPGDSELAVVALSAPVTAYSHDPRRAMVDPPSLMAGGTISLVSAVQARNNARMVVAGSLEMFTNEFFDAEVTVAGRTTKSGNAGFVVGVSVWALQGAGVIKAENLRHHLIGSDEQPSQYRVNDDVELLVDIWQLEADGNKTPYRADDVQVEFTMLNPYVRATLQHDNAGSYSLRFKVPDVYGVFKYTVEYRRRGYSAVQLTHQVPVRPFKHNEYERFLLCAYPYYASAATSMVAFFLVGLFFLYHK